MVLSAVTGIALDWSLLGLAFIVLIIRLYIRWWLQHRLSLNDAAIVAAFIFFAYVVSVDTFNWTLGFWGGPMDLLKYGTSLKVTPENEARLILFLKLFYIGGPMYYTSLWCIKANFILLYYKLVSSELKKLRRVLHIIAAFTLAGWVVAIVLNTCYCVPISRNWTLNQSNLCLTYVKYFVYFTTVSCHLFTDILVYAFPFALIRVLALNRRSKISISIMFALGLLCILCTIGRIISAGTSFNSTPIGVWASAEMSSGVIVSCLPSLKILLLRKTYARNTEILPIEGNNAGAPIVVGDDVAMITMDTDKSSVKDAIVEAWMMHRTITDDGELRSTSTMPTPGLQFFERRADEEAGEVRRSFDPRDHDELEPPVLLDRPRLTIIDEGDFGVVHACPTRSQYTVDDTEIGVAIGI